MFIKLLSFKNWWSGKYSASFTGSDSKQKSLFYNCDGLECVDFWHESVFKYFYLFVPIIRRISCSFRSGFCHYNKKTVFESRVFLLNLFFFDVKFYNKFSSVVSFKLDPAI